MPIKGEKNGKTSSFWNVGPLLGYPTPLQALVPQSPSFPLPWPQRPYTDFPFFPISPALGALSNFKPKSPSLQVISCILGCFFTNWATLETELVKSEDKQEKKKRERERNRYHFSTQYKQKRMSKLQGQCSAKQMQWPSLAPCHGEACSGQAWQNSEQLML